LEKRIIFRLPDELFEQAKQAVKRKKAETVSDLLRMALTKFLEKPGA
jgi:Arc/MetJ-type ribon-helix-helix transcriptional regulator